MASSEQKAKQLADDVHRAILPILDCAFRSMYRVSCINCNKFIHETEICSLAGMRPPAETIALGCPKFEDEIPF